MTRGLEKLGSKARGVRALWVVSSSVESRQEPRVFWRNTEKLFGSMIPFRVRHRKHVVSNAIA